MDKQKLRNALCEIEDKAREHRNALLHGEDRKPSDFLNLVVQLTQIIREEIVK